MPPEYIERCEITSKFDVFSLGVMIVRIIAGDEGYSKSAHLSSQEFLEHVCMIACMMMKSSSWTLPYIPWHIFIGNLEVHENWGKRLQATMSPHTSEQIKTCIQIALRCVEVDRENRPAIAEIVGELNKVNIAESSLTSQVHIFWSVVGNDLHGMTKLHHLPYPLIEH
jgi:pyruvate dehydrogenase phosphatase